MVITKPDNHLYTSVYRKMTNKGLLPHYQSYMEKRYKRSLIRTMLDLVKRLSSSSELFSKECSVSETEISCKRKRNLNRFHAFQDQNQSCIKPVDSPVFQTSEICRLRAQATKWPWKKIDRVIQPVFTSRKISEDLKAKETKPSLVNQQCLSLCMNFNVIPTYASRSINTPSSINT